MDLTRKASIWLLLSTMFLTSLGFGVILPTLPFLSKHLGATPLEMGLAISVFSVASLFSSFLWGAASDRLGRRPVLIMGIVGYGLSSALLALAPNITVLLILRFLAGMMASAVSPSSMALVTELTSAEERPRILGYMGSINGIGFIFGPPVGAFLSIFGIGAPFASVGLLSILNGLLAMRFLPRGSKPAEGASEAIRPEVNKENAWVAGVKRLGLLLKNRMIAPLLFGSFVIALADASISSTLSYYITGPLQSTQTMAGWAFMMNAGVSAIAQATVFARIFTRYGDMMTIVIGFSFGAVGFFLLGLSHLLVWAFGAVALLSLCRGLAFPSITTGISLRISSALQGSGFGSYNTVGSLGRTLGPLIAGWLFSVHASSPFFFSGGLLLLTVGAFLLWTHRERKTSAHQQSNTVQKTV
ncbi:MFS transporter [Brevibacillus centrosporus]|uniref:MFS transporter n=1 Tax=Brevibacillus centrosporus TaxID=54910 RepID=UPI002E20AA17|nr:MFS transporter [Brevibacillus centrosporus]